ncbi:tRNA (adenosine(37)-N6)-threonylcarbamoyltransferase complex dimerization subunit type 1 TsaB [Actinobaculum sp. 313]|nr:tRNA (adenosine(37)-N6)-threonylcarbamoyltransferase complex dimerization subunit type 1 TsaB [Actinobaculum sp. 313]
MNEQASGMNQGSGMNILTIDTSDRSVVGVVRRDESGPTELAREISADARHHAETLTPMVQRLLEASDVMRPDMVIVGTGPGAFTGLRAGLMTGRALSRGWNVPIYGVSSLESLAAAAGDGEVLAVIDARRREVFTLRARVTGDDVEVLSGPTIAAPSALEPAPTIAVQREWRELPDAVVVQCEPVAMVRVALAYLYQGEEAKLGAEPQYLRRPDIHGGVPQSHGR